MANYQIAYAYATSTNATKLGHGNTGCYYIQRDRNVKTGLLLACPVIAHKVGFATEVEAAAAAEVLGIDVDRPHRREN